MHYLVRSGLLCVCATLRAAALPPSQPSPGVPGEGETVRARSWSMVVRRKSAWLICASLVLFGVICPFGVAPSWKDRGVARADEPASEPAAGNEQPGVSLTFNSLANNTTQSSFVDSRLARLVALYVPKGEAPSPFTPAGPFKATFEGDINMRLRNFLVFSAIGRGKLTLTIGGNPALALSGDFAGKPSERIRLGKGKNHFVATYESPAEGDAELRLLWSYAKVVPEPLPPMVLTCSSTPPLDHSLAVREGRFQFATFRCAKCHATGNLPSGTDKGMPELAMDAPSFDDIGGRLSADWMAKWIENPRAMRPNSHMPRLFGDDAAGHAKIQDAVAYLVSLGTNPADANDAGDADAIAAGGRVFASLNCTACHTLPDAMPDAERVSLQYVRVKFLPGRLREYLLKPESHYAWNPMPDLRLSDAEATQLTAFLLSFDGAKADAADKGDVARGKAVVESAGCLSCHQQKDQKGSLKAPALAEISKDGWTRGCLGADAGSRKTAPDFALADDQRAAIEAFGKTDAKSFQQDAPAEFAERQFQNLHCAACHARDGVPSLLASTLESELNDLRGQYPADVGVGEAFAPDQRAPLITWVGEKLRPAWMARFIGGQIPYKPRTYLHARMPTFGMPAKMLALGFASEHGCPPELPPVEKPNMELAAIGQKLIGKAPNQSLGCVQCHAVAKQPPLTPFEAPAPNFDHAAERLRKDYYFRWVHDPLRVDPETKMPRFDDDDGKTGIANVFGGDAHQQFDAIWQFILEGETMQPPAQ